MKVAITTLLLAISVQATSQKIFKDQTDEFTKKRTVMLEPEAIVGKRGWAGSYSVSLSKAELSSGLMYAIFIQFNADQVMSISEKSKVYIKLANDSVIVLSNLVGYKVYSEGDLVQVACMLDEEDIMALTSQSAIKFRVETNSKNYDAVIDEKKRDVIKNNLLFLLSYK